jgi:hypothetical protein
MIYSLVPNIKVLSILVLFAKCTVVRYYFINSVIVIVIMSQSIGFNMKLKKDKTLVKSVLGLWIFKK